VILYEASMGQRQIFTDGRSIPIDDPKAYTAPWTVRVNQVIIPDEDLLEFVCLENNHYAVH
jgi:hypothetical protein